MNLNKLYRFLCLCLLLLLLFITAFQRLQVLIFNKVLIYGTALKLLLLFIILFMTLVYVCFNKGHLYINLPRRFWILFVVGSFYLLIAGLLLFRFNFSAIYIFYSLSSYYFFFLIILLLALSNRNLQDRNFLYVSGFKVTTFLSVATIPLICLGFAQFLLNDPILSVGGTGEAIQVMSWYFYGHVRAFSLFNSGSVFGIFLTFIGAVWLNYYLQSRQNFIKHIIIGFGLILITIAILTTLTRAVYIFFVLALLGVFLARSRIKVFTVILISSIIAIGFASFLPLVSNVGFSNIIANNDSLMMRFEEWRFFLNKIGNGSLFNFFFGYGLIQTDKFDYIPMVIDNNYLAIFLYNGLIGLILNMLIFYAIFSYCLNNARKEKNPLWMGLAGFLFGIPTIGMVNIVLSDAFLFFCIVFISTQVNTPRSREQIALESREKLLT